MEQIDFTDISEIDSIKNSKFYDIIKNLDIMTMTSEQKEELKIFILSLSEEEQESVIIKFLDNDFAYMSSDDEKNEKMKNFLSDDRLLDVVERLIEKIPPF